MTPFSDTTWQAESSKESCKSDAHFPQRQSKRKIHFSSTYCNMPIRLRQAFSMGFTKQVSPSLVYGEVIHPRKYITVPSSTASLLDEDLKNGVPFKLQPWKHGAVFHFSLGPLMCKETIRNKRGLIVLRIRNHHSMRMLSSADCVLAAKCETMWGLSFGFCF